MNKRRILFVVLAVLTIFAFAAQAATVSLGGGADREEDFVKVVDGDMRSMGDLSTRGGIDCHDDYKTIPENSTGIGMVCAGKYKDFTCDNEGVDYKKIKTDAEWDCVPICQAGEYYRIIINQLDGKTTRLCDSCSEGYYCLGGTGSAADEQACPKGTERPTEGAKSLSECTKCESGKVATSTGTANCGYCGTNGKETPTFITSGYAPSLDHTICEPCGCDGTTESLDVNCKESEGNVDTTPTNVTTCGTLSAGKTCKKCTACNDGYKLSGQTCLECPLVCPGASTEKSSSGDDCPTVTKVYEDEAVCGTYIGPAVCYSCSACPIDKTHWEAYWSATD